MWISLQLYVKTRCAGGWLEEKQRENNKEEEEYRDKTLLEEFRMEKMGENVIVVEEETIPEGDEDKQTEDILLDEDPENPGNKSRENPSLRKRNIVWTREEE